MKNQIETPFDSLENAQQYIKLLAEAVAEATHDIGDEITLATSQVAPRRVQALRIVEYNLEKLQRYLLLSGRTLNDLRSLRRLLEGRPAADNIAPGKVAEDQSLANTVSAA